MNQQEIDRLRENQSEQSSYCRLAEANAEVQRLAVEVVKQHRCSEALAEALEELSDWYLRNVGLPAVKANAELDKYRGNE